MKLGSIDFQLSLDADSFVVRGHGLDGALDREPVGKELVILGRLLRDLVIEHLEHDEATDVVQQSAVRCTDSSTRTARCPAAGHCFR